MGYGFDLWSWNYDPTCLRITKGTWSNNVLRTAPKNYQFFFSSSPLKIQPLGQHYLI